MKTTWSGMSACYKAPEQETLYAAMDPVDTGFDTLADNVERVGEYLDTFATTVEGIKKDAQTLKTDAETFLASIKDDSEWTYDQNKVDTQNGLVSRAGALQVRLWDAERTCANNIRALDCLVAYHADPTSENDPLGYGYSEIPAGATGEWGGPVERDDHCPKRAAVSVKRAVWDDFVLGTVNGLTNFAGIEIGGPNGIVSASWETFTSRGSADSSASPGTSTATSRVLGGARSAIRSKKLSRAWFTMTNGRRIHCALSRPRSLTWRASPSRSPGRPRRWGSSARPAP